MKKLFLLPLFPGLVSAQTLRGQVQDLTGRPVPYASVAVPTLKQGATADAAGQFGLPNLPSGSHRLEISALGYATASQLVVLPTRGPLLIKLKSAEQAVGEVVVTGVGRATETAC